MTRWLVTGAGGMLGRDVTRTLMDSRIDVTSAVREDLDITDFDAVAAAVRDHSVVINTAAWTNVDGAEKDEVSATGVNGVAVERLAIECEKNGKILIHISTDYVFDGTSDCPYTETSARTPTNSYGRSKLVGELAVLELAPSRGYVVRSAWMYGAYGNNFVRTILRLSNEKQTIGVVNDQFGQPTWSMALAKYVTDLGTSALCGNAKPGVYHAVTTGVTTWCGLAKAVFEESRLDPERIKPITTEQWPSPAKRPHYSVLRPTDVTGLDIEPLGHWRSTLHQALPLRPREKGPCA